MKKYKLNKEEIVKELIAISSVQAPSGKEGERVNYIIKKIDSLNDSSIKYNIDKHGNLLVVKGELSEGEYYPCIVSHLDTVHSFKGGFHIAKGKLGNLDVLCACDSDKKNRYGGVGDDSNGIAICLEALKAIDKIKVAFFVQEECGGIGSGQVELSFFDDCGYILEGDRKGKSDLIFTYFGLPVISEELIMEAQPIFDKYNYREAQGVFTDVMILFNRKVGISVFNFSVGYYNAHTDREYTVVSEFLNSVEFALDFITIIGRTRWEHEFIDYDEWIDYNEDEYYQLLNY